MTGPTARTLKELRSLGYVAQVVEKWIPQCRKRLDLFGCIDILSVENGLMMPGGRRGILAVQATSGANHSARVAKAKAEPLLRTWLETGSTFEVWSWAKRGARGKRKLWTLRREHLTLNDLPSTGAPQ